MPDPIANLQGQDELPPVTLPAPVRVPQPPAPVTPTQEFKGQGATPPGGPQRVQVLPNTALDAAGLPQLPQVTGQTKAPVLDLNSPEPNAVVSKILAPDVAAGVYQVDKEIEQGQLGIEQAQEVPTIYSPPNLGDVVQGFVKDAAEQQAMLRRQIKDAETREVASRMLEELRNIPQTQGSSTSPAFDWVNRLLGMSEDGGRSYAGPAVFNKKTGEWEGSAIGGILYALGLPQNTVMGTALDLSHFYRDTEKKMSAVYERFIPPWMRNQISTLAEASRVLSPLASTAKLALDLLPKENRYYDGKSNLVEALRGAQYSFSDESGKGFGIKQNVGVRIGAPKGSKQFGFDFNPTVVAGVALDIAVGDRTDALLNVLGKAAKLKKLTDVLTLTSDGTSIFKGGKKAAPEIPAEGLQLSLPLVVNPKTPAKAKLPKLNVVGTPLQKYKPVKVRPIKVEQLELPIKYIVQGELPLGEVRSLKRPPKVANRIESTANIIAEGTQLKLPLKFDSMPEALDPVKVAQATTKAVPVGRPTPITELVDPEELRHMSVEELLQLADDVSASPLEAAAQKADILNNFAAGIDTNLYEALDVADATANIGRQFVGGEDPVKYVPPSNPVQVDLPTIEAPAPQLHHGTRVEGLDIPSTNPLEGASRSELGPGIYLSTDPAIARQAAEAQVNVNLPPVEGRALGGPVVHTVENVEGLRLIDALSPSQRLTTLANQVAEGVPGMSPEFYGVKSLTDVLDDAAIINADEGVQLAFQRSLTEQLVAQGYDGARAGKTVAVYNPSSLRTSSSDVGVELAVDSAKATTDRAAVELDSVVQTGGKSQTAITNAAESDARRLAQLTDDVEVLKPQVEAEVLKAVDEAGLMKHPDISPSTLDDRLGTVESKVADVIDRLKLPPKAQGALYKKFEEMPIDEFVQHLVEKHPKTLDDLFDTIADNPDIFKHNPCGF
jgi:hypothetical protein